MAHHPPPALAKHLCGTCGWPFEDSLALEAHKLQNGHGAALGYRVSSEHQADAFTCEVCGWPFDSLSALGTHKLQTKHGIVSGSGQRLGHGVDSFTCENCSKSYRTREAYNKHRRFPSDCSDAFNKAKNQERQKQRQQQQKEDQKQPASIQAIQYVDLYAATPAAEPPELQYASSTSSTPSNIVGIYCHDCRQSYETEAQYNRHTLLCAARNQTPVIVQSSPSKERAPSEPGEVIQQFRFEVQITPGTSHVESLETHAVDPATSMLPEQFDPASAAAVPDERFPEPTSPVQSGLPGPPTNVAPSKPNEISSWPVPAVRLPKPPSSTQSVPSKARTRQAPHQHHGALSTRAPVMQPPKSTSSSQSGIFPCPASGCKKKFKSEEALRAHQAAKEHYLAKARRPGAQVVGGQGLGLQSKGSLIADQHIREQLKNVGLLKSGTARNAPKGPTPKQCLGGKGPSLGRPMTPPFTLTKATAMLLPPVLPPVHPPIHPISGPADIEQGNQVRSKILRLLIQNDIFIQHDGSMVCGGISWTRIGVNKQFDVVVLLDKLTHLPAKLQTVEYLPPPKIFKDEQADYPAGDFSHSPDRNTAVPGLAVVSLSCSKVLLSNGMQEAVKVAAVDVLTCQVLLDHLVCTTDPIVQVKDWRRTTTGLSSFGDLEAARQAGYKVFKGWPAARAALWKFIDTKTILVGHNLRSDLDTLRMIHGRAVDVAKLVEKAASGPLSKQQLSLDSLSRDFPKIKLETDPRFGRDVLQNAFAARELALWILKQGDEFTKRAKQRSLDYQRVNATTS